MNLKKIQSLARRRLGIKGEILFKNDRKRGFTLSTFTDLKRKTHTISYSDLSKIDEVDIYHEMCKARVNEFGFAEVETEALDALKEAGNDSPSYLVDANSALVITSEVYTNWLLYTHFAEETRRRREELIAKFESSDALTSLRTRLGFWGIAGIAYQKIACDWSSSRNGSQQELFPDRQIESAMNRASTNIREEYEKAKKILSTLPKISPEREQFDPAQRASIVTAIMELFKAGRGS